MKKLYLFDFDGTLTHYDTMFLFLKFYNSKKFYIQFALHTPLFILLKLGLSDAEKVKKSFISSILKGEKRSRLETKANEFFSKFQDKIIRKNAQEFIANIDRGNTEIYIVSASLDVWVQPFADFWKFNLLATQGEFENEVFTGNFVGKNCNGAEKLCRIENNIDRNKFDKIIAFGDSAGDREMLEWAHESHFEFFH